MARPPSPRTFTSPRTVSGAVATGALPGAIGVAIARPLGGALWVLGTATAYALITHSPRWAPHCPFCDGRKPMGRAECWSCRRVLR
jgi:hypothetical protein